MDMRRVFESIGEFKGTAVRRGAEAVSDAKQEFGDNQRPRELPGILLGAIAGFAGGFAEVAWVGLYSFVENSNGFDIARQVTGTMYPGVSMAYAATLGLMIHFALSIGLGIALVRPLMALNRWIAVALAPVCISLLGLIWVVNFLLVLPVLNPAFLLLLPAWVTLASKLMFGATLAAVLGLGAETPHLYRILRCGRSSGLDRLDRYIAPQNLQPIEP